MVNNSTSEADWAAYYRKLSGRPPRPLAFRAVDFASQPGLALDLGCGDGTETRFLLDQGWSVIAVDLEPTAVQLTRERARGHRRVDVHTADLVAYEPPAADLILASATLPFMPPAAFRAVWTRLYGSLNVEGLLAVHLFGDRDSWAGGEDAVEGMTFHSRQEAEELLTKCEVLQFEEREFDGDSGRGPKHWHRFEIIARKQSGAQR